MILFQYMENKPGFKDFISSILWEYNSDMPVNWSYQPQTESQDSYQYHFNWRDCKDLGGGYTLFEDTVAWRDW